MLGHAIDDDNDDDVDIDNANPAGAPGMPGHAKVNVNANPWHAKPCQRPLGHAVASPPASSCDSSSSLASSFIASL